MTITLLFHLMLQKPLFRGHLCTVNLQKGLRCAWAVISGSKQARLIHGPGCPSVTISPPKTVFVHTIMFST